MTKSIVLKDILYLCLAFLLQLFFVPKINILGVMPDFVLVTLIFVSFHKNLSFGLISGFCVGLLMYFATGFGMAGFLFSRSLVGAASGYTTRSLSGNSDIPVAVSVLCLTPLSGFIMFLANPRDIEQTLKMIAIETALNLSFAIVIILVKLAFFKRTKNYYID